MGQAAREMTTSTYTAPVLDPDSVAITDHAMQRYTRRRNTLTAERGLRNLIAKAAGRPTPPLLISEAHGAGRKVAVGGFVLVFDSEMRTLITMWRGGR